MKTKLYSIALVVLFLICSNTGKATPEDSLRLQQIGKSFFIVHKVDAKETLYAIALRYNVTEQSILINNTQIKEAEMLRQNDFLMIPYQDAKNLTSSSDVEAYQIKHEVVKNDNLTQLSKRYNVSVDELMKWNDLPNDKIKLGQQLIVGIGNRKSTVKNNPNSTYVASKTLKEGYDDPSLSEYKVLKGDNLIKIALKYGVTVDEIKKWNQLKDEDIFVGQVLKIQKENLSPSYYQIVYMVEKGDILGKIAANYSTTIADICKWNKIDPKNPVIQTGTKLNLFPFGKKEGLKAAILDGKKVRVHTVEKGQGLRVIAEEYYDYKVTVDELKNWNKLASNDLLIGQKLLIYTEKPEESKVITASNPIGVKINTNLNPKSISCGEGKNLVTYIISEGDVMWDIAKKFSVKVGDIKELNNKMDDNLKIGDTIYICTILNETTINRINQSKPQFTKQELMYKPELYIVQENDNLTTITKKYADMGYSFTVSDLSRWNKNRLEDHNALNTKDTLLIIPIKSVTSDNNSTRGNNGTIDPLLNINNSGNSLFNSNNQNPVNNQNNTQTNPLFADPTKQNNNDVKKTTVNQNLTSGGQVDSVKSTTTNENAMKEIVNIQGKTMVVKTGFAEMIEGTSSRKYEAMIQGGPLKEVIMIKNLENGKTIYARVVGILEDNSNVILKLSEQAFKQLSSGTGKINVEVSYTAK